MVDIKLISCYKKCFFKNPNHSYKIRNIHFNATHFAESIRVSVYMYCVLFCVLIQFRLYVNSTSILFCVRSFFFLLVNVVVVQASVDRKQKYFKKKKYSLQSQQDPIYLKVDKHPPPSFLPSSSPLLLIFNVTICHTCKLLLL